MLHGARRQPFLAPGKAACGGQRQREFEAGYSSGQVLCLQPEAIGIVQLQRQSQQVALEVDADALHQAERGGIGADQDVLTIVEGATIEPDPACPSAQGGCGLEQLDPRAALAERDCCGQSGPAATDHGDPRRPRLWHQARTQVDQASQSLRKGVSEVRWCST